jgi:uncharacterized protein
VSHASRPSVAVIGSGISGLTAAHVLARSHEVTLFEADRRLGGHAHTHDVLASDGRALRIDSGFIIHNERTYPQLLRLFGELGVQTRPTKMGLSVTCDGCGLSYAGGVGLNGLFAQRRRAVDPRHLRMLAEVPRFHRAARAVLADTTEPGPTWGEFLAGGRFSRHFVKHFAIPLVACVWSAGDHDAASYPARHLFTFLEHHGMLQLGGSPIWRTVVGGSATYVEALAARLPDVRREARVAAIVRHSEGVDVRTADDRLATFDKAVVATHADDALRILADATVAEKNDLGAIGYSVNETWLHRDASALPPPRARASWNYRMRCDRPSDNVLVSYWMNRLQGLADTDEHIVTLNPNGRIQPALVSARMSYSHPIFTHDAVAAARRLRTAGGDRLAFAGAHLGWGFHEDGCRSGVWAAEKLGVRW